MPAADAHSTDGDSGLATVAPKPDCFRVPTDSERPGSGRENWVRKNLGFHPLCVVELPGAFASPDLSVDAEFLANGVALAPATECPLVRIDGVSVVALVPLPRTAEGGRLRLVLKRRGERVDSLELETQNCDPLLSGAAETQIERLIGFRPKTSVLTRAWARHSGPGPGDSDWLVGKRALLEQIAELLRRQFAVEGGRDAAERLLRGKLLAFVDATLAATVRELEARAQPHPEGPR